MSVQQSEEPKPTIRRTIMDLEGLVYLTPEECGLSPQRVERHNC